MERQKARYAARQNALNSIPSNPPTTVIRGSNSEAQTIPKPPTIEPQKVDSTQRKRSVEVERDQSAKDNDLSVAVLKNLQRTKVMAKVVQNRKLGQGLVKVIATKIKANNLLSGIQQSKPWLTEHPLGSVKDSDCQ